MARVPYLSPSDVAPEDREMLQGALNIRRALANSPKAARHFGAIANFIRHESRLDPRLREMAILQVGYLTRCAYEYCHHIEFGKQFGVSDDDIRAIAAETAGLPTALDPLTKTVLKAAREITADRTISDATFATLKQSLDNERLTELVVAVSMYNAVVRVLGALQVDIEDDVRPYLDAFPLPKD